MFPAPSALQALLAILSGFLVGFSLGLIGGGGSILAVPLLLYRGILQISTPCDWHDSVRGGRQRLHKPFSTHAP
jgi:Sulfite exporter TauE/SafE.